MAAAQQVTNGRQVPAPRAEPPRSAQGHGTPMSWRLLYSARPRLMPTVYVPGPVVTVRKV